MKLSELSSKFLIFDMDLIEDVETGDQLTDITCRFDASELNKRLEDTDIEDIHYVYPELRAAKVNARLDYKKINGDVKMLVVADDYITSVFNSQKIDYRIVMFGDSEDRYVAIKKNTMAIPLDDENDLDNGQIVFITRL